MKFGKQLEQTVDEQHPAWKKYAVDYKGMKKSLRRERSIGEGSGAGAETEATSDGKDETQQAQATTPTTTAAYDTFWEIFAKSQAGLGQFYEHQSLWVDTTLRNEKEHLLSLTLTTTMNMSDSNHSIQSLTRMKEHLLEFRSQVELVRDFLQLNQMAFSKILKKYDKHTLSQVRDSKLAELLETEKCFEGGGGGTGTMDQYITQIDNMLDQLEDALDKDFKQQSQQSSSNDPPSPSSMKAGEKRTRQDRDKDIANINIDMKPKPTSLEKLQERTDRIIKRMEESSPFFTNHPPRSIPQFDYNEITVSDTLLGRGQFCSVHEIQSIRLLDATSDLDEQKLAMQQDCCEQLVEEDGDGSTKSIKSKYAIKQVNDYLEKSKLMDGAIDLVIEAKFLSCLSHPNIITICGIGGGNGKSNEATPSSSSKSSSTLLRYFLILDRLEITLHDKIYNVWKPQVDIMKRKTRLGSMFGKNKKYKETYEQLWNERINALKGVANGIKYLHSKGIIHRDIKPSNIGFDIHGEIKIFDFGLVKELLPKDQVSNSDSDNEEQYHGSGRTGTRKYMAAEGFLCKPYGRPLDIYSMTITIWETLSLQNPFDGYDALKLSQTVVEKGVNLPMIPKRDWPNNIREMIQKGWSNDPPERPTANEFYQLFSS